MAKKDFAEGLKTIGYASTLGIQLVLAILIGWLVGFYLDNFFGTSWLVFVFLIFGVIAGYRNMIWMVKREQRLVKDKKKSNE